MEGNGTEISNTKEARVVATSSCLSAVWGWRRWHAPGGTGTSLGQGAGCILCPATAILLLPGDRMRWGTPGHLLPYQG